MEIYENFDLQECPICGGVGILEEEEGWCYYVSCMDCGCHTAEIRFRNDDERLDAAKKAVQLWDMGKVLSSAPGE